MPKVLYSPDCIRIYFDTLDVVEDAIRLFSADPVIDVVSLPKAHLLWGKTGYTLHLPNRAIERVINLLKGSEVPFTIIETS